MADPIVTKLGGGSSDPIEITTHGRLRARFDGRDAYFELLEVEGDPSVGRSKRIVLFARLSGGNYQLCARFPSGVIQVLATEPV